ncbi:hypothetical protein IG631_19875 [Alternaria alternata]|nr:hypothetical protein IG631_19875 [Alternaria alternata]
MEVKTLFELPHGLRLPVFLLSAQHYLSTNTGFLLSHDFQIFSVPKDRFHQHMETGDIDTFDHAVKLPSFRLLAIEYTGCLLDVYYYTNVLAQVFPKVLGCVLCGLEKVIAQTNAVNRAVCFLQV